MFLSQTVYNNCYSVGLTFLKLIFKKVLQVGENFEILAQSANVLKINLFENVHFCGLFCKQVQF